MGFILPGFFGLLPLGYFVFDGVWLFVLWLFVYCVSSVVFVFPFKATKSDFEFEVAASELKKNLS